MGCPLEKIRSLYLMRQEPEYGREIRQYRETIQRLLNRVERVNRMGIDVAPSMYLSVMQLILSIKPEAPF